MIGSITMALSINDNEYQDANEHIMSEIWKMRRLIAEFYECGFDGSLLMNAMELVEYVDENFEKNGKNDKIVDLVGNLEGLASNISSAFDRFEEMTDEIEKEIRGEEFKPRPVW
jgi:hypothetical protein